MIKHKAVYRGGSGEIIEKKSRFIANVKSIETVEEAQAYIEAVSYTHLVSVTVVSEWRMFHSIFHWNGTRSCYSIFFI